MRRKTRRTGTAVWEVMAARDLILHDVGPATLVYLPVLVEVLEAPEQPTYELADEVHAQAWLLNSLERRLADYAITRGSTPLLLNALGAAGDLVDRLADLHTQLVAIDQPGGPCRARKCAWDPTRPRPMTPPRS